MKRIYPLLIVLQAISTPCFAGFHFGLGKAAAVKSASVIEKGAAKVTAKANVCASVPGATSATLTDLAAAGTSLDVKTGATSCTTGGCLGFTTTGNNFVASGAMTGILSVGTVCGLGGVVSLPTSGSYIGSVSAQAGVGYIGKLNDGSYVRFYVSGFSSSGANIQYQYPFANTLTVSIAMANSVLGSGNIFTSPSGISCSNGSCSAPFITGSQVTLVQSPASGSNFITWSGGGCSGSGNSCILTINSNTSVTGTFCLLHGQVSYTTFGTYTHVACATTVTAQVWGAGGGSSTSDGISLCRGGGGGGGGYGSQSKSVTSGASYTVAVGSGGVSGSGSGTQGTSGGKSSFNTISATGGHWSWQGSDCSGGVGGTSSATTNVTGSTGGTGNNTNGGAGGAGANGGAGGAGMNLNTSSPATNGVAPGGGGGGGGGVGGLGRVTVTW